MHIFIYLENVVVSRIVLMLLHNEHYVPSELKFLNIDHSNQFLSIYLPFYPISSYMSYFSLNTTSIWFSDFYFILNGFISGSITFLGMLILMILIIYACFFLLVMSIFIEEGNIVIFQNNSKKLARLIKLSKQIFTWYFFWTSSIVITSIAISWLNYMFNQSDYEDHWEYSRIIPGEIIIIRSLWLFAILSWFYLFSFKLILDQFRCLAINFIEQIIIGEPSDKYFILIDQTKPTIK